MRFGDHRPISGQLVDMISMEILDGTLAPGARVPSAEEIAMATGTNPRTVEIALAELEGQGAVRGDGRGGRTVTDGALEIVRGEARRRFVENELPSLARRLRLYGIDPGSLDWDGPGGN